MILPEFLQKIVFHPKFEGHESGLKVGVKGKLSVKSLTINGVPGTFMNPCPSLSKTLKASLISSSMSVS